MPVHKSEEIAQPIKTIWCASNRSSAMFFEDEQDAKDYACSFGPTVYLEVTPAALIPKSK